MNNYKIRIIYDNNYLCGRHIRIDLIIFNVIYSRVFYINNYQLSNNSVESFIKSHIAVLVLNLKESEVLKQLCYEKRIKISEIDFREIRENIYKEIGRL